MNASTSILRFLIDLVIVIIVSTFVAYYYRSQTVEDTMEEGMIQGATLSKALQSELRQIAQKLVESGKGILAADEKTDTMGKRLATVKIENNEENRRNYRQMLFTTPNISQYISGIILFEETLHQKDDNGKHFVDIIREAGVLPGIKLDKGLQHLDGTSEYISTGLDDLSERAAFFKKGGCQFAKWRSVYLISEDKPTRKALKENAKILARYAVLSQQAGLVPIIEPEVLWDGDHDLEKTGKVTEQVLAEVYKSLHDHGVYLEGTLLKPNMVVPGPKCPKKVNHNEIASATVQALLRTVPAAVPGIVFLSGGQSEIEATRNLNEINKVPLNKPWKLSFSYGRALQTSALKSWAALHKKEEAQSAFIRRARLNGLATEDRYVDELE